MRIRVLDPSFKASDVLGVIGRGSGFWGGPIWGGARWEGTQMGGTQ